MKQPAPRYARSVAAWAVLLVTTLCPAPAGAQESPPPPEGPVATEPPRGIQPVLGATSAMLVDLKTSKVLVGSNEKVVLPPASLTKMVTALVVRDRYRLDDVVTVSPAVLQVTGSKLGLEPGMQFTVEDLLHALMLKSANDAATALAAHELGGIPHFIELMNAKARAVSALDSNFVNPHGLDAAGHVSTAWDMALFGRQVLADPVLADIVSTRAYTMQWPDGTNRTFDNHNKLLDRYSGTIGVKTGFTNRAGRCLVAALQTRDGMALSVVMHSPDHYRETAALFDYFKERPPVITATEEGSGEEQKPLELSTPRPLRRATEGRSKAAAAPLGAGPDRAAPVAKAALMALLAAMMLLTLQRPRRLSDLAEASQFHPYLEPLAKREGHIGKEK
ncbi:MAG TPA: D-alanyl-D-alanine carboxypeptidase family protein [Actinomycetota bacterium]|nr:D-alanyl-D-alanine carboxypeptidase family protein [Actinomycetota bacterium]